MSWLDETSASSSTALQLVYYLFTGLDSDSASGGAFAGESKISLKREKDAMNLETGPLARIQYSLANLSVLATNCRGGTGRALAW